MYKNVLIWTIILVGCIDAGLSEMSCKVNEVKSLIPGRGKQYYDYNYGGYRYQEVYSKLYSFATCEGGEVDADFKINIDTSEELKYIIFQNSKVTTVPVHIFASLHGVQEMYLNSSEVETIQPGAFTGLANLKQIYLQDNNITKLSAGIFNSLSKLEILNVANNVLGSIEEHTFLGVVNLKTLDLHGNNLSYILPNTFANLRKLEYVDLSQNYLNEITPNVFATHQLISLNLSSNSIQNVTFSQLPNSLQLLNLSHNVITEVHNLSNLLNLLQLDVSFNEISQISFAVQNQTDTSSAYKLIELDIGHNLLRNISLKSLYGLQDLKTLNLAHNLISTISIGSLYYLQSLTVLNMSINKIEVLDFGIFGNLDHLDTLDISHNRLNDFQESILHGSKNLSQLYLSDNLIRFIDALDLKAHCAYLKTISLHNNPWDCLSLGKLVKTFEKYHVTVVRGPTTISQHVNGISCYPNKFTDPSESVNTTEKLPLPTITRTSTYFDSLAQNINRTFNTFFDNFQRLEDVLRNFSFHAVPNFENLDVRFKNTSFYKFFTSEFNQTDFVRHTSKFPSVNAEHEKLEVIPNRLESHPPSTLDISDKLINSSRLDDILVSFKQEVTIFMVLFLVVVVLVAVLLVLMYLKIRSKDEYRLFLQRRQEKSLCCDAQLELI